MQFSRYHIDSHPLWLVRKLQMEMKREEESTAFKYALILNQTQSNSQSSGKGHGRSQQLSKADRCLHRRRQQLYCFKVTIRRHPAVATD